MTTQETAAPTCYTLTYRYRRSGETRTITFDSAVLRLAWIVAYGSYVDVIDQDEDDA